MDEQLQELAYFCRNPRKYDLNKQKIKNVFFLREEVMNHLLSMPEGAFVLRYSESRKRCLALSVRVPKSHGSGSGISHYLIVWNEKGFRIKVFDSSELLHKREGAAHAKILFKNRKN